MDILANTKINLLKLRPRENPFPFLSVIFSSTWGHCDQILEEQKSYFDFCHLEKEILTDYILLGKNIFSDKQAWLWFLECVNVWSLARFSGLI